MTNNVHKLALQAAHETGFFQPRETPKGGYLLVFKNEDFMKAFLEVFPISAHKVRYGLCMPTSHATVTFFVEDKEFARQIDQKIDDFIYSYNFDLISNIEIKKDWASEFISLKDAGILMKRSFADHGSEYRYIFHDDPERLQWIDHNRRDPSDDFLMEASDYSLDDLRKHWVYFLEANWEGNKEPFQSLVYQSIDIILQEFRDTVMIDFKFVDRLLEASHFMNLRLANEGFYGNLKSEDFKPYVDYINRLIKAHVNQRDHAWSSALEKVSGVFSENSLNMAPKGCGYVDLDKNDHRFTETGFEGPRFYEWDGVNPDAFLGPLAVVRDMVNENESPVTKLATVLTRSVAAWLTGLHSANYYKSLLKLSEEAKKKPALYHMADLMEATKPDVLSDSSRLGRSVIYSGSRLTIQ